MLKTTGNVDVAVIGPVDDKLAPVVELSDGTRLIATDYADAGEITVGQRVCHSGQNEVTATLHEVCGHVVDVGATSHCAPNNGSSTCVVSVRSDRADGYPGDHGDSGAAAYTYNPNGTITIVGTYKSANGGDGTGQFEPTYAAIEVFGGHPYTTGTCPANSSFHPNVFAVAGDDRQDVAPRIGWLVERRRCASSARPSATRAGGARRPVG